LREAKKEKAMLASKRGSVYESGRYLTQRREDAKEERREKNEEGVSIKKSSRFCVSPENLCFFASLRLCVRPKRKRQCSRASVDKFTNQEGISRKDAKTQRRKEGKR
jgi:hypothetical protein